MRRVEDQAELIDGPLEDSEVLRESLRDLRRVNRWLGGVALSRSALIRLATGVHYGPRTERHDWRRRPLRLLDVGTGAADIPAALLEWAQRRGIALAVEAVDERPEMVELARELNDDRPELRLEVGDGRRLPYPDAAFDVAHTSLMAHHLDPGQLSECLVELRRVSRLGVIVNDLDRNRLAWVGAWLLARLFTRNPLSKNDGPLSVRRAYRPSELAQLASRVGLVEVARVRGFLGHRYAVAFVPSPASDGRRPANNSA